MNLNDLIWAAGFFDGEGCACVHKTNPSVFNNRVSPRYIVSANITQNDREVLENFLEWWGGCIAPYDASYRWVTTGNGAVKCLTDLFPYLRLKQEVAGKVIEFRLRFRAYKHRPAWQEEIDAREKLRNEVHLLNS